MKLALWIGTILTVSGLIGVGYQSIGYPRKKDVGPVQTTRQSPDGIPIRPVLAEFALLGGIALVTFGTRGSE
jgi:hypothetical protein